MSSAKLRFVWDESALGASWNGVRPSLAGALPDGDHALLTVMLEAARLAGAAVRALRGRPGLGASLSLEGVRSLVETVVREHLRIASDGAARDVPWKVAPLEGTRSLITGQPHAATLIVFERHGEAALAVVHAPLMGSPPGTEAARAGEARGTDDAAPTGDLSRGESRSGTRGLVQRLDALAGRTWCAARGAGAWVMDGTRPDAPARRLQTSQPDEDAPRPRARRGHSWWDHILVAEGKAGLPLPPPAAHQGAAALALRLVVTEARPRPAE